MPWYIPPEENPNLPRWPQPYTPPQPWPPTIPPKIPDVPRPGEDIVPALPGFLGLLKNNPYVALASAALPLVSRLWDTFTESPRETLEKEILQARKERLADLRRHAKGKFTPAERHDIRQANEQVLNRVATNIAQRGLEVSGAAGQLLAEAELAPFREAQRQARAQLDNYDIQTYDLAQKMAKADDGFVKDLQKLLNYLHNPKTGQKPDPLLKNLDTTVTSFQQLLGDLNKLRGGQS